MKGAPFRWPMTPNTDQVVVVLPTASSEHASFVLRWLRVSDSPEWPHYNSSAVVGVEGGMEVTVGFTKCLSDEERADYIKQIRDVFQNFQYSKGLADAP